MSSTEEEFQMTAEEVEKFRNALKKQEFRDLLSDYVKEIQDPVNKKRYQDEITEMERKRGQSVKFINPTPGFVIRVFLEPGHRKVFINICLSDTVAAANCVPSKPAGTKKNGTEWHIPYSLSACRDDLDKSGKRCIVYDCVYHPKTHQRAQKYVRFKQLLVETAVEAVETEEKAKIAPGKIKFLSMPYKGMAQPSIVRKESSKESKKQAGRCSEEDDFPFGVVYPPLKESSSKKKSQSEKKKEDDSTPPSPPSPPSPLEPAYTIKYRGEVAMGDYTNDRVSQIVKRPKEIIITVKLPQLSSVETVELDVLEKQLLLENKTPPYHLDLALSYPVDQSRGKAEFDKTEKCLTVTLPVLPPSHPPSLPSSHPPLLPSPPPSPISELTEELESCDMGGQSGEELTNQITDEQTTSGETKNDSIMQSPTKMTSSDEMTKHNAASEGSHITWTSKGEWSAPSFTYRQDNERVVFVLHSSSIKTSTVVHHSSQHQFQVMYSCIDNDSKQTVSHSLLIRFHDDDLTDNTTVDISDENMVVIVTKAENCQRTWAWFEAGPNPQSTERKLFMTETAVKTGREEMNGQCDAWESSISEVNVSSLSSDTVAFDIMTCDKSQVLLNDEERLGDNVVQNGDIPVEVNGPAAASGHNAIVSQLTNELLFDLD